jgi:hypothetical protein
MGVRMGDYLRAFKQKIANATGTTNTAVPSYNAINSNSGTGIRSIFMGIATAALIITLILIVIHYTITPIFKIKSGKGYIPIPGMGNNGQLLWTTYPHDPELQESSTILKGDKGDLPYTMQMDMYFDDLNAGINPDKLRPLFLRYSPVVDPTSSTVNYSLGIFLEPNVNDMLVQIRTTNRDTEVIRIRNVPSKKPIRVGVTVSPSHYEVYYNGRLVGTRALKNPLLQSVGILFGAPGQTPGAEPPAQAPTVSPSMFGSDNSTLQKDLCNISPASNGLLGGLINLNIWQYVLSADEMYYAGPTKPTAADFMVKKLI